MTPVALSALAAGRGRMQGDGEQLVTGVTATSGEARPGDLFVALPGARAHGAAFAADAVSNGAAAVLTDDAGTAQLASSVSVLVVPDVRGAVGDVSAQVYGNPASSMQMIGVTGTSGKTTTTFLLRAGLAAVGRKPGLIGTVATMIGVGADAEIPAAFTTPEAPDLQALLAVMRERGVTDVAMEVSSHALAMRRVDGMTFDVGGFTNLSEDHLDFHADMEDYFAAKLRFVRQLSVRPITVTDDDWGKRVATTVDAVVTVNTTQEGGDWTAHDVESRTDGTTSFRVVGPGIELTTGCAIPGRYNVANVLLALAMLTEAGFDPHIVAPAVASASVPGRMERVDAGQSFLAVVDYSHKPAAIDGALRALRPLTKGKLIIVVGCGGDRDRGKRPHMGAIAARDADVLVVTDDNPRSEDPAVIRQAMLAGALAVPGSARADVREVGGRADAIAAAVEIAGPGDTVLVAGKGHETGQEIAGVKHPFDDRLVLRRVIEATR